MEKRKFTIKEKVALIILAVLMVAVAVVGAALIIGNTNRANEQLLNTEHTTIDINIETEATTTSDADSTERKADDNTEGKTEAKTTSSKTGPVATKNSNETTAPKSTTSKNTTSSNSTNNNSKPKNNIQKPSKIEPATNATHASDNVCTVNGKKCYVGDTVTLAINLKTPVILENYQGYTKFDGRYLEFIDVDMNSGGIYNEQDGVIYYNASILSGIDFTSGGTIYTATFKVKKEGSTEIKNTIQVLTDRNDKPVKLSNCKEEVKVYD